MYSAWPKYVCNVKIPIDFNVTLCIGIVVKTKSQERLFIYGINKILRFEIQLSLFRRHFSKIDHSMFPAVFG